mmetsp:Transcript_2900/g.8236  ORF Transcript_2900/g.8236 Transcript_2900/m.8236 type:complete len:213 (-) Transcript_2900:192-830(-)
MLGAVPSGLAGDAAGEGGVGGAHAAQGSCQGEPASVAGDAARGRLGRGRRSRFSAGGRRAARGPDFPRDRHRHRAAEPEGSSAARSLQAQAGPAEEGVVRRARSPGRRLPEDLGGVCRRGLRSQRGSCRAALLARRRPRGQAATGPGRAPRLVPGLFGVGVIPRVSLRLRDGSNRALGAMESRSALHDFGRKGDRGMSRQTDGRNLRSRGMA